MRKRARPRSALPGAGLTPPLDAGLLLANGRLANGARELRLTETVRLSQRDLREVQLAKAAIAAGLRILCARRGVGGDSRGGGADPPR